MQRLAHTDLLDEESLEGDVLAGFVRKSHGNNVGQSLSLMDDGVREGELPPVFNLNLTESDHPAELLLDLVWERTPLFPCLKGGGEGGASYLVCEGTWPSAEAPTSAWLLWCRCQQQRG